MDLFILLSMALVFIALFQTTDGAYFVNRNMTANIEATNRLSRLIYPILLLAVLGISFA